MSVPTILDPPPWASDLVPTSSTARASTAEGVEIRTRAGDRFALVSGRVPHATALDESAFRAATAATYEGIFEEARRLAATEPVRIWNVIPHILDPLGDARHRYMVFNAGRHDAFARRYGASPASPSAPTASGIGHSGAELVIHVLTATRPGRPIENPRQVPACEYSTRYGQFPPWFARATRIDLAPRPWLLVGGTASVVGEDAIHGGVDAQLEETARNLEALLGAAPAEPRVPRALRVYYVRAEHADALRERVPSRLGDAPGIEYLESDLCRPELLVEIEGVYELDPEP